MTVVAQHTTEHDDCSTGMMVFHIPKDRCLVVEPCWLHDQGRGFIRLTVTTTSGSRVEEVYDYAFIEAVIQKSLNEAREKREVETSRAD